MAVSPKRVGEIAVRQTLNNRLVIIPGNLNKVIAFVVRILPRRWITAIYSKLGG